MAGEGGEMKYCGIKKCKYKGVVGECLVSKKDCEHLINDQQIDIAKMLKTIQDFEAGRVIEVPDLDSVKCAMPPTDHARIADALERIATTLEKANELKAIEIKMGSIPAYRDEHDGDELAKIIQSDVNKIMED